MAQFPATLRKGSNGEGVTRLQELLRDIGYDPGGVDGEFGPGTESAVKRFQSEHGLDADGVVGPNTWTGLVSQE
jgi:peptidoglycan hydrolase-like protein with peptidoglycan-binding domain